MATTVTSNLVRWLATGAAIWNGAFLVFVGLWVWPRTLSSDPRADIALFLAACFLPLVGAICAIFRPRTGSYVMLAATGVYLLVWILGSLEVLASGERVAWNSRAFYMFVVPSSAFAVAILLGSRRRPSSRDGGE